MNESYYHPEHLPQQQHGGPQEPKATHQAYSMPQPQKYGAPAPPYSSTPDAQQPQYPSEPPPPYYAPEKPKWNDVIFVLLFLANIGGFVAVSVIGVNDLFSSAAGGGGLGDDAPPNAGTANLNTAYLLALVTAAAFVLSLGLLWVVKTFTKVVLEICLGLSVVFSVAYAIYLWIVGYYSGAIIFTIFAIISIICYFPMRRRIPFSTLVLQFVIRIANEHKSTYGLAILSTVILAVYSAWWSFAITGIYSKYNPNSASCRNRNGEGCNNSTLIGLAIFLVFSFYWTTQVISNVALTSISGIFGTHYFSGSHPSQSHLSITLGCLRRAVTYSFGSICEGSLIVALLETLRAILNILASEEQQSGDFIGYCLACIARCFVGCVSQLVQYFNRYAYIEIALFGKKYIDAARDTWRLLKDRGIDALINDCLVSNIWTFGSFAVGALCSFFVYIYLKVSNPSYIDQSPGLYAALIGYGFVIGFFISHSLGYGCLSSGVSTVFVCLGERPMVLAQRDPVLFEMIREKYPRVVMGVV
ncbi:DUF580-domain-containing protein [Atractiella rhizophila]|nr:DUF580-domain-containing protein [Atractiella rhizophila]